MEWNFWSDMPSTIGGFIIIFYACWQAIEKAFGNIAWIQNKKEKKDKAAEEKLNKAMQTAAKEVVSPLVEEINKRIDTINEKQMILIASNKDLLRKEILKIYYRYLPHKRILNFDKEFLTQLYIDYKAQDGNSFIQDIWEEMKTWDIVLTKEELEKS